MSDQPETETKNVFRNDEDHLVVSKSESIEEVTSARYYYWDHSMVQVCGDCGVLVFDTIIHDRIHERG